MIEDLRQALVLCERIGDLLIPLRAKDSRIETPLDELEDLIRRELWQREQALLHAATAARAAMAEKVQP